MSAPVTERPVAGLSRTATGRSVPLARLRGAGRRLERPVAGWAASLGVALLALALRLWHLGRPHDLAFDETYYAKDAWSLLNHGYALKHVKDADEQILDGATRGFWLDEPSMVVHPEVGKWLIGLGEELLGLDPVGWRIASVVAGALMVLVMVRLARRLTGSTMLGCVAGLMLSFDGLHFVLSRLALLDIFVALFTLCAVHCVVADRQWFRARLASLVPDGVRHGGGPRVLWRPWLLAGGLMFGLAVGSKWTALYVLAAFGLLAWLWSAGARRSFGVRRAVPRSAVLDGLPAFGYLVGVALLAYTATWTGWLLHADQYEEHLSDTQYTRFDGGEQWPTATEPDADGLGEVWQSVRSLAHYHRDVYVFHTHFLDDSDHSYQSQPSGWLLLNRPVGVSADTGIQPGKQGCEAPEDSDCLRQVLLLGTPALWWGGCLALVASAVLWVGRRDWRFGVPVVGTLVTWLPWLANDDRPIFLFYAVMCLPFLVLATTLVIGVLLGDDRTPAPRRTAGVVVAGAWFLLVLLNFAWFWPIYTHELLTHADWADRVWFSRWV